MIAAVPPNPHNNVVRVYADISYITIGWTAPSFDGGSPVIGYKIYWDYSTNGMAWALIG